MIQFILSKIEGLKCRGLVKRVAEGCFSAAHLVLRGIPFGNKCPVCGALEVTVSRPVVGQLLIEQWNLDAEWVAYFNHREGQICISCGASVRVRQLARVLVQLLFEAKTGPVSSVREGVARGVSQNLKLAEVNSCGALHKFLSGIPGLSYSEFLPEDTSTAHENLLSLTYPDESFDFLLHSDTVEHVPDVDRAFAEIWRVLKPGGMCIFSIPWVRDGRETLIRARVRQTGELAATGCGKPLEEVEHLLPPSYHGGSYQSTQQYLVFYEFGVGFLSHLDALGFQTELVELPENPAAVTLVARKPGKGDAPVGGVSLSKKEVLS
jgi:SAM-dependent methyltransferase